MLLGALKADLDMEREQKKKAFENLVLYKYLKSRQTLLAAEKKVDPLSALPSIQNRAPNKIHTFKPKE